MTTSLKAEFRQQLIAQFMESKGLKNTDSNIRNMKGTYLEIEIKQYLYDKGMIDAMRVVNN